MNVLLNFLGKLIETQKNIGIKKEFEE